MRVAALLSGLTLSLAAGAALACPSPDRCGGDRHGPPPASYDQSPGDPYEDAYRDGYDAGYADGQDVAGDRAQDAADLYPGAPGVWEDDRGLYIRGHRGQACGCAADGLALSSGFFEGAGGVGPIPNGGYSGGGYYYVTRAGGSAYAFSSASARASASVSVGYRGSHGGHGGGKRH
jgi:hypothetical protein